MAIVQARLAAAEPTLRAGARSFDVSGDVAVLGLPGRDTPLGVEAGAAQLFRRDTSTGRWLPLAEVTGWDLPARSQFGRAVAITPDVLAVGAPGRPPAGAVYFFVRDGDECTPVAEPCTA